MPSLRDDIFTANNTLSMRERDSMESSGMNEVTRGFRTGRLGTDANALAAQELNLRAAGDVAGADALRAQIATIQQRQSVYAPEVQRVEDINGVGSALRWGAGQVGQGVASMVDPVAVSAGINAVSRVLPHPGLRAAGAALGYGVPYLMNQRQMTGEFANEAYQDPALIARTSPTQLRDAANVYGAGAGALDTILPGIAGRQLTGAGLKKGISRMGPGTKTVLGMAGEGVTEGAQDLGSKYTQGVLNPDRDTSGDSSDLLNSFAGGAIGGGPIIAAGNYADAGYRRVGDTAQRIGTKTGELVDLAKDSGAGQMAGKLWGSAKDKAAKMAGDVVDLSKDEDGEKSIGNVLDKLKAGASDLKSRAQNTIDEHTMLMGTPPEDLLSDTTDAGRAKVTAWFAQNDPKRAQLINDKLEAMEDDPEAQSFLKRIDESGDEDQMAALDDAAQFLVKKAPIGRAAERADKLGQVLGKGAMAVGKTAFKFGKAVLDGAKSAAKKNEQVAEAAPEDFQTWRDRHYGVQGKAASDAALKKGAEDVEYTQRVNLAARYADDMLGRGELASRPVGKALDPVKPEQLRRQGILARHIVYSLASMARDPVPASKRKVALDRYASDMVDVYQDATSEVLAQLGSLLGTNAKELVSYMSDKTEELAAPGAREQVYLSRSELAQQVVDLVPAENKTKLLDVGINLMAPGAREQLLGQMEDVADRIGVTPGLRKKLDEVFGAEAMPKIMELLNGQKEETPGPTEELVDDRTQSAGSVEGNQDDEGSELTDFDKKAAEKNVAKGSGPKVYAFSKTPTLRTHDERNDAFGPMEKPGEDGVVKRPSLFTKGEKLFGGADAVEKKIADTQKQVGEDFRVEAKSAYDVMKDLKMQPGKILQLYRDYMRMDHNNEKLDEGVRKYAAQQAKLAHSTILDSIEKTAADGKLKKHTFRTTPRDRAEVQAAAEAYFKERFLVTGEQLSDRDPSKITVTELLSMHKEGQRLLDAARKSDDPKQAVSDANLMMFKSDAVKGGQVAVPAGKLVLWVRQQRGKSEMTSAEDTGGNLSDQSKDKAYLADVMEGIAVLIGSGHVEGLPYKVNQLGEAESFTQGVAPSLRLATTNYGSKVSDDKERVEAKGPINNPEPANQLEVAKDQNKNAEFFTPEDRADPAERDDGKGNVTTSSLTKTADGKEITRTGRMPADRTGVKEHVALTDDDGKTPLDFFPESPAVPDEFDAQRYLSKQTGATTDGPGPESKMTAVSSARFRADKIMADYGKDPEGVIAALKMRMRTAALPAYNPERGGLVGGVHYAAPVAYIVNSVRLAEMDLSAKELGEFAALRRQVAQVLLTGEISDAQRLQIAKLMSTDPARVTLKNVKAMLAKVAASPKAAPEVANAGLPKGQATRSGPVNVFDTLTEEEASDQLAALLASGNVDTDKMRALAARVKSATDAERAEFEAAMVTMSQMADGTYASKGLAQQTVNSWAKKFAGGAKITVIDLPDDHPFKVGIVQTHGAEVGGAYTRVNGEHLIIMFRAGGKRVTSLGRLAHEFGHALQAIAFDSAPESVKQKLTAAYESDKVALGVSPSAVMRFVSPARLFTDEDAAMLNALEPWKARRVRDNLANDLGEVHTAKSAEHRSYIESFPEWFAENFSKFVTSDMQANLDPEIKSFWAKLLRGLKRFFQEYIAQYKPNENFKAWVESLAGVKPAAQKGVQMREHASEMDELAVEGNVWKSGQMTAVEVEGGSRPDGSKFKKEAAVYADAWYEDGNYWSGWFGSLQAAERAAQKAGIETGVMRREMRAGSSGVLNAQGGDAKVASQAEMDEAKAYVSKVLGPKIKTIFKDITTHSGEYIEADNVIEISTTAAAGTMQTAYHEALHAFFAQYVRGNPELKGMLDKLVNNERLVAKLHALLDGFPAAQAQLASGEERLAYTYQFWAAGMLQVDAKANTWLQKIGKFFRRVLGMVRDSEKALELFEAFHSGALAEPSAAGRVIAKTLGKGKMTLAMRRKLDGLIQGVAALTVPSGEILAHSASAKARELALQFFTNPGDEKAGGKGAGYLNARRTVASQYTNTWAQAVENLDQSGQAAVQKYLQSETELKDIPNLEYREAVKKTRDILERFHQHMTEAGLKIGKIDKYYPTVWNLDKLLEKQTEFKAMLVAKYGDQLGQISGTPEEGAQRVWQALVDNNGVDTKLDAQRDDGVLAPFFASQEGRTLAWLKGEDKEAYLQKDMVGTLTRYFHQGARAAEYTRRFGEGGQELDATLYGTITQRKTEKLPEIRAEDGIVHELKAAAKGMEFKTEAARAEWVTRQMRDVRQSVSAMEGTLGKDISPNMRRFTSWMAVYQNIRLLPMSLFSSFVDPLGLVARGATMSEAYEAFLDGMREVFRTWGDAFRDMPKERVKTEWQKLAEHVGAVDVAMFSHFVGEQYASAYMSPGAKKVNDKMFVLNGMEAWNRGMRVAAVKSAVKFIERHSTLPDKTHSRRWLAEIGLAPDDVMLDTDGNLITDRHELVKIKGMDLAQATRRIDAVHHAINRWVEGAVLTPNAAQRPAWSSDPHYSMFFHLKQFSYSFHQTILKRAVKEMEYGNLAPMGAFIWYVPTMIAADIAKGLIQGGGELPAYMQGYDAGDWMMHGVQRAGLLGVGTVGVDAQTDIASLGGPAVEQIIDSMKDPIGRTAVNSLPLHAIYAEALK